MLQPQKKKLNPAQKAKASTPKTKSKAPASYDVDWDAVRSVNDNVAVQAAKMFDPTGITSYPDVYYAGKDLYEGKGSVGNLALSVLGALPMIGKAKTVFHLARASRAPNKVKKAKKVLNTVEKIAEKANDFVNYPISKLKPLAESSKIVPKVIGKTAKKVEKLAETMGKPLTPKGQKISTKQITKSDIKNLAVNLLDIANVTRDVTNVGEQVIDETKQKLEKSSIIDKNKIIEYYNTDPKRGEVETPGVLANVQYVPVSNSAELKRWEQQKLAFGTGEDGISKVQPKGKEVNLAVKETIPQNKGMVIKKKPKNTTPVSSDISTKVLRSLFGAVMPDQAAQFLSAITTKDNKLGVNDLTPDIKEALFKSVKNAQKRTGKNAGGTQYIDYSPEVEQAFQGMTAGPGKMVSIDPATQAAAMLGRVSFKNNSKGETEIYDSYDFSETNSDNADTLYKKVRAYAGQALPDKNNQANLIGVIPAKEQLAFGTNENGIMKTKMNPRKRYANGTNTQGVGPNNYIQSPNEVLNDYNIMLAETDKQVASNSVVPIVSLVGGLLQQGISMAGSFKKVPGATPDADTASAANGMNNVNQNVEVEGGEMYETPQGETGEFQGPSHEQGGIPLEVGQDVEEGTKIYSDRLKVGKQTLAERKEARERKIANLEKIAAQPLVDVALKNATQRKMMGIQKEEASDLQFQEQVNNMQAMADTMVKAFGTSMAGIQSNPIGDSMRYAMGTSADGVTEYFNGTDPDGIDAPGFVQGFGMEAEEAAENPLYYDLNPSSQENINLPGTMVSRGLEKGLGALSKSSTIPGVGDIASLFGDYLGATSGLKNVAEQRSTDVTHTNVYKNAGTETQKQLDKAMSAIEGSKAQAIAKATATTQGGKKSGRNSARGVNQMRGMDWLYDTALNQNIIDISTNAAGQVSDIFKTKATAALNVDQLKGQGEYQANMANEAAKDAYYTAKGLALKDQSLGVQQIGKDLNAKKQNEMIEKLMKSGYGKWVGLDKDMNSVNKEDFKMIDGVKYKKVV
jgi:hypothetical protein